MADEFVRVLGDVAVFGFVVGAVLAAGVAARRVVVSERAALAAEADERCADEGFRVLCSGLGRAAARRGLEDYVADVDRLQHRAGQGRMKSGREAVGQGFLYAAVAALVLLPLLYAAMDAMGVVLGICGIAFLVTSVRSGLVATANLRKREIESETPYALDLLGLCMSARASEAEALEIAARGEPRTAMTDVLERVKWECGHNVPMAQSISKVGDDLQVEALIRLGHEIDRSRNRGIDLPEALRSLADSERRRRFDSAEAYANEVSTRMLGPSGLVFLSALVLMLGPVVMSFLMEHQGG